MLKPCQQTATALLSTISDEAWTSHFLEAPALQSPQDGSRDAVGVSKVQVQARTWLAKSPLSDAGLMDVLNCVRSEIQSRAQARPNVLAPPSIASSVNLSEAIFRLFKWNRARLTTSTALVWPTVAELTLTLGELSRLEVGNVSFGNSFFLTYTYGFRVDVCWAIGAREVVDAKQLLALIHKIDGIAIDGEIESAFRELRQMAVGRYVEGLMYSGVSGQVPGAQEFWERWMAVASDVGRLLRLEQTVRLGLPAVLVEGVSVVSEFHRCRESSANPSASRACGSANETWKMRSVIVSTAGLAANLAATRAALVVESFRARRGRLPSTMHEAYSYMRIRPDQDPYGGGIIQYYVSETGFTCRTNGWTVAQVRLMDGPVGSESRPVVGDKYPAWLASGGSNAVCNVDYRDP